MGFPKAIYEKASAILAQRRQDAKEAAALQRQEIYSALPKLSQIDQQLAQVGMRTIRAVASAPDQLDVILERLKTESLALQAQREHLLEQSGLKEAYEENHHTCKLCQDTGYVKNQRCQCFDRQLKETAYRSLGASGKGDYRFSNFMLDFYSPAPLAATGIVPRDKMAKVKNFCIEYAKSFSPENSRCLLLMGGTGLGKTHISLAIAEQVINKGFGVVYGSTQNLLSRLEKEAFSRDKFSYDNDDRDRQSYLNLLLECDLLILDDLGTEFLTQYVTSTIYNLVNTRLIENRPTLISTNLELGELSKRYSERLVSRLFGGYIHLNFLGRDVRIQSRLLSGDGDISSGNISPCRKTNT